MMRIITPYGLIFDAKVGYFLGGIDIYDQEETLGAEIRSFNPNDPFERECVIKKYILPRYPWMKYRDKYIYLKVLEEALSNPDYDFSSEFAFDYEGEGTNVMAWDETEIDDPRGFFEDIYRVLSEAWSEDLKKAAQEDQSTW